jgi:ElaB/YqjD/DUF883 family membrane-anchored ribosome-binding protein
MFRPRSGTFDRQLGAVVNHLHAIETELGAIGQQAGRRTSESARAAGDQIADVIGPILNDIVDRFSRGRRAAAEQTASLGGDAARLGVKVGNDVLARIASEATERPLITIGVAVGVGILIGMAGRRS